MRNHAGNILNQINYEEHDGDLNAKRVVLSSNATIFAVVNTTAPGISNSLVSVINDVTVINKGNVTVEQGDDPWNVAVKGNITLSDPKGFIGLVTVVGSLAPATGNVTLDPGSRTGLVGNVTLSDSKTYIGLTTTTNAAGTAQIGSVTVSHPLSVAGNMTLSDSKTFIGLVSVGGGILNTITAVTDITNPIAIKGNVTLSDSKTFIGLVTVVQSSAARTITGNVTLSDAKTGIGLVSVFGGSIGIAGNVTLSDAKTFIGLVTAQVVSSNVTVYNAPYSYWNQSSLISGYVYHGLALPNSNPTTTNFRIQRETLNTGEVVFGGGAATFVHAWSAASLASLTYL